MHIRTSRRAMIRFGLRATAVAGAVTLTLALAEGTSRSAFTASTGTAGSSVTAAGDFCPGAPASVVTATADTSISQTRDDTLSGTDTVVNVWAKNADNVRTLVRFPLPTRPTGCVLIGATLQLYNTIPANGRVIQVFRVDPTTATWGETTVRWGSAPATAGTAVTSTATATVGWQNWNVTAQVAAQYASGNRGFLVKDIDETGVGWTKQVYSSREGTQPPKLTVTWG